MTFGSVCSGIEAASVAWNPLGWKAAWFSEIDPFCNSVLTHHYPETKNFGDFTTIGSDAPTVDVLIGGTPCQDFSITGQRAGVAGERGNLTYEFLGLAGRIQPRWIVWENVAGVLSSDGGRTFGTFLGRLAELGYGFSYRVLDAQFFGVAQRRRRVFVVAHSGKAWQRAAAVLFEQQSGKGNSNKSGKTEPWAGRVLPCITRRGAGSLREEEGYIAEGCGGVRHLTARENERAFGFPDDYTLIEYRGRPAADGNRTKAIGNSMAVPVIQWIGQGIEAVEASGAR